MMKAGFIRFTHYSSPITNHWWLFPSRRRGTRVWSWPQPRC